MSQKSFNPLHYGFAWTTDGWYTFDHTAAHKAAKADRDSEARRLRKAGHKVRCSVAKNNLMSQGGIGSGKPHIELSVDVYRLTVID